MIGRLCGTLVEKDLRRAVVDVGGVGFEVTLPLPDLSRAGNVGDRVTLRVHTHVREDAIQLFGFLAEEGRVAFQALLSVTGIGPKLAVGILSGIEPGELVAAVNQKDLARLCAVPGVGRKTAERLCLELSGKLGGLTPSAASLTPVRQAMADLGSALENLGYKGVQIDKVLRALEPAARDGASVDVLVRDALKLLARGAGS